MIPSQQAEDQEVSNFKLDSPNNSLKRASWLKSKLENSQFAKLFLLYATMLGTSMVIGDGVLTPCISGLFIFLFDVSLKAKPTENYELSLYCMFI